MMGAPALIGCVAAALCLGIPVMVAGSHLVAAHEITGAADAAALAAADALTGWRGGDPCQGAAEVAGAVGAAVARCDLDEALGEARIVLTSRTPIGTVTARARAGGAPPTSNELAGDGVWVWPAATAGVTQGFHDGLAIDLAAPSGSQLYAPHDGVVVIAGPDGAGVPAVCMAVPGWWRGANETVMLRHEVAGQTVFSSHNHIAPGSAQLLGLAPGALVRAGQAVALAGMSGCTSGPHTHFTLSTRAENAFPDLNPFAFLPSA